MKKRSYCLKASFTVEAAFVVPIVIFAIVSLIWIIFYLHNSVAATADIDICIFKMEKMIAENRDTPSGTILNLEDSFENILGGRILRAVSEYSSERIKAEIRISGNVPNEGILGEMLKGFGNIKREREIKISGRSETARLIKAGMELIGDIVDIFKDDRKD